METNEMQVVKRNNKHEDVSFDKILTRLKTLGKDNNININYSALCLKVIDQLYDKIETTKIDELAAQQCASMITVHYDYGTLAGLISISNHQKNTELSKNSNSNNLFKTTMNLLYKNIDCHGLHVPLISKEVFDVIVKNESAINSAIDYKRDYLIDYFGFKTLERAYLIKINNKCIERPQDMWMRVSIGIHGNDIEKAIETYHLMSTLNFTHATPTLFNAGTPRPQLSSCFLLSMTDDSINGIFDTLKECAQISKWAGGIGLHVHNIRAKGTQIRGTNGTSNGLVPMLKVFNDTARYVDQGGGKRNGSFAIYLDPIHPDIEEFLDLKKNHGDEESKARDLFYALWIPDLFMKKVMKDNEDWCLFCPDQCPGFSDAVGDKYEELYNKYEAEKKYVKKIKARDLWFKILDSQMETGTPYLLYKDACNLKSNQQNLGVIKSSNLCTEIVEYSSPTESAVCNLASVALSKFVVNKQFDYDGLHKVVKIITRNLNKIIDINYYPTDKTKRSNLLHRPIGIGVQGLADAFILMDIPYSSLKAREVNKDIFETIYHASIEASNDIAIERAVAMNILKKDLKADKIYFTSKSPEETKIKLNELNIHNNTQRDAIMNMINQYNPIYSELTRIKNVKYIGGYSSFEGSPASKGNLQFDLWGIKPSERYDWNKLKNSIKEHGLRNSLCIAPMPTASTSQILGNNECIEPFTSNIYTRRTLAGEFIVVNKHLMKELTELGLWNEDVKNNIIANKGSVQYINGLPDDLKEKYKIVWEIPMKHLINMAADRGAYICQSQSLNLWLEEPNYKNLTAMHFYSWKAGLKTGIYYLRRKPRHQPQQFTIKPKEQTEDTDEECLMCGS
tara:strand:+ start:5206 stop:7752 length:2547 start_codon:yes stop_codon:yes gene_type:complete